MATATLAPVISPIDDQALLFFPRMTAALGTNNLPGRQLGFCAYLKYSFRFLCGCLLAICQYTSRHPDRLLSRLQQGDADAKAAPAHDYRRARPKISKEGIARANI